MPKVSVIIPTYNYAPYLPEAIESVLAQTYTDLEIIVVDDNSDDDTPQVIGPYLDRMIYIRNATNQGPSQSRNIGMARATGSFIAFLDADDIWEPRKLELQMAMFERFPHYGLVYSDLDSFGETGHLHYYLEWMKYASSGYVFDALIHECFILLSSVVVKRECLKRCGLFDPDLSYAEGYDLWLRITKHFEVGLLKEPLVRRRMHDQNLTLKRADNLQQLKLVYLRRLQTPGQFSKQQIRRLKTALSEVFWEAGYVFFKGREYPRARREFRNSLKYRKFFPRSVIYWVLTLTPPGLIQHLKKLRVRSLKRFVQRVLGTIPAYHKWYLQYLFKGNNFVREYQWVSRSQHFSVDEIRAYQDEHLREIVRHAAGQVPFYRDLFARHGIDPEGIRCGADLQKIPVIRKQVVVEKPELFTASGKDQFRPVVKKTSGSTGTPLRILVDARVDAFAHALIWRHYNWAGCRFHDRSVYIGPPFGYQKGYIDSQRLYEFDATHKILKINTALINVETLPELCAVIERFNPGHIHSYPSIISVFAKFLADNPSYRIRPRSIILRAEKLYPEQRQVIEQTFQCRCFEFYGMWEHVVFAAECEHGRLHLNFELGLVEILRDGRPCLPDQTGEIVATTLVNHAMPLIRYATGDYGRIKTGDCPCGRQMPVLEVVGSREKDLIVTKRGFFGVMSGLPLLFDAGGHIEQIQFYQQDIDHLIVRIVRREGFTQRDEAKIKGVLDDYFLNSINIAFEYVKDIPRTAAGKYKYVDSRVPVKF